MSCWYESQDDTRDTYHWIIVAVSYARAIGLHQRQTVFAVNVEDPTVRKRTWWSCYIWDRLAALGMGGPMVINAGDCDLSMPSINDFDFAYLPNEVSCLSEEFSRARLAGKSQLPAVLCIELAKLCVYIGQVLQTNIPPRMLLEIGPLSEGLRKQHWCFPRMERSTIAKASTSKAVARISVPDSDGYGRCNTFRESPRSMSNRDMLQ